MTHHPGGDEGQPQGEGAALAFHALDGDRAAVLGDDLFGAGQPDPGAGNVPLHVSAPTEAVEDIGEIGGGNAQTAILDRHDCPVPVFVLFATGADDDVSPAGLYLMALSSMLRMTRSMRDRSARTDSEGFGFDAHGMGRADPLCLLRAGAHIAKTVDGPLPELERLSCLQPGGVHEIVDQSRRPHRGGCDSGQSRLGVVRVDITIAPQPALQQLRLTEHRGQRVAQVVGGCVDEGAPFLFAALSAR